MRHTSIQAYEKIKQDGTLNRMSWAVYQHLYMHGPLTARELDHGLAGESDHAASYHKRLSEMERMGVVRAVGDRKCRITGNTATEWDVTSLDTPLKLAKRPARKPLAERRLERLRMVTAKAARDLRALNDMFALTIAQDLERELKDND